MEENKILEACESEEKHFLEVRGLKKRFGKNEVLKGVDLTMDRGEIVSIIGASGSGKSTFLRCLNFLEFADAGSITLEGELLYDGEHMNVKKMSDEEFRTKRLHFGLVFQSFNLFPQ